MQGQRVKELLKTFYSNYELESDGGFNNSTVTIRLTNWITLFIPNFETRKKVALKHDIHHLVTGYSAIMKGEMEISTWELSSGCWNNWVALSINTYAMMIGLLFNISGVWKAWLRGKNTRNLYYTQYTNEELLEKSIDELKEELGFMNEGVKRKTVIPAFLSFLSFIVFGFIFSMISLIVLPLVLLYSLFISIKKLWQ